MKFINSIKKQAFFLGGLGVVTLLAVGCGQFPNPNLSKKSQSETQIANHVVLNIDTSQACKEKNLFFCAHEVAPNKQALVVQLSTLPIT
jgi:hypothetical protein